MTTKRSGTSSDTVEQLATQFEAWMDEARQGQEQTHRAERMMASLEAWVVEQGYSMEAVVEHIMRP